MSALRSGEAVLPSGVQVADATTNSSETHVEEAIPSLRASRSPPVRKSGRSAIIVKGIQFSSISEAVCGLLLEHFLPGFAVRYGDTFQVPLGEGRAADFCVNGVLIEFHPVRMEVTRRERDKFRSYNEYLRHLLHAQRKGRLSRAHHRRLKRRHERCRSYVERRREAVQRSAHHGHRELVVVTTIDEFYLEVISRFSPLQIPSGHDFFELFEKLTWQVRQEISPRR